MEPFSRAENWYLALLAVHPAYQGHGFGRELVEWGIRAADEERVCASVLSSEGNDDFYLKCGFDERVGNATEGEGNPLRGVKGGSILFRWARVK
jgi:predicted N-acetyltransferase YhbS